MNLTFDHTKQTIFQVIGIDTNTMMAVDQTLLSLPPTDTITVTLEKALHIHSTHDEAIAYLLIKLGSYLGTVIPAVQESDKSMEEPKVFDIHTGKAPE